MKKFIKSFTFIMLAVMLIAASGFAPASGSAPRNSAGTSKAQANDSIHELVSRGIIGKDSYEASNPDSRVTRAFFVKMLVSALKLEKEKDHAFKDTEGHWANQYIGGAVKHGIIIPEEYDGSGFLPDEFIKRAEAAQMVARAIGKDVQAEEVGEITAGPDGSSLQEDDCITFAGAADIMVRLIDRHSADPPKDITIAILGTDERSTETSRSDIIMLMKYNRSDNKVTLVSVPRDTRVRIDGYGNKKINSAYALGGAKLLVTTLQELFNIKVDNYIKLDFKDFVAVIDALGGVEVNAQKDFMYDNSIIIKKGISILNGEQALFYVRYRSDSDGDFGRIKRQQEVIHSISSKLAEEKKDSTVLSKLVRIFIKNVETDISMSDLLQNAKTFEELEQPDFDCYTLNTSSKIIDGVWYELIDNKDLKRLQQILGSK